MLYQYCASAPPHFTPLSAPAHVPALECKGRPVGLTHTYIYMSREPPRTTTFTSTSWAKAPSTSTARRLGMHAQSVLASLSWLLSPPSYSGLPRPQSAPHTPRLLRHVRLLLPSRSHTNKGYTEYKGYTELSRERATYRTWSLAVRPPACPHASARLSGWQSSDRASLGRQSRHVPASP